MERTVAIWAGLGVMIWLCVSFADLSLSCGQRLHLPRSVQLTYAFCATAYCCNLLVGVLRMLFMGRSTSLHILSCYISLLASATYTGLWLGVVYARQDIHSVLFLPSRWTLYVFTMPAIWWILAHVSTYTLRRKLYVLWLNWVMLIAGGIATVPWLSWRHKVYWMVLSCAPFPELCRHMWRMLTDAIEHCPPGDPVSTHALRFVRAYGQFSYQFFPAIYFAAFDGCLPLAMSEPLWALCDWCLKMVMTSSLMEANFYTVAQRQGYVSRLVEQTRSFNAMKQLTLAMERKDNFLSAMSHELRTPLNGIIGMAQAVNTLADGELDGAVQATVDVIKLSGKRLLQLINDILDVAQIRNGSLIIRHEPVDMGQLIDEVIELLAPQLDGRVKLFKRRGATPVIVADAARVVQILFNLLSNALKFTVTGFVRVATGCCAARGSIFLSVRDTGCGIPNDDIAKVFAAFEQGDMTTTRVHGGTGLGLHLVKELVRAHRGHISVRSKVGSGTIFVVWLPMTQPRGSDAGEAPPLDTGALSDGDCSDDLSEPRCDGNFVEEEIAMTSVGRHMTSVTGARRDAVPDPVPASIPDPSTQLLEWFDSGRHWNAGENADSPTGTARGGRATAGVARRETPPHGILDPLDYATPDGASPPIAQPAVQLFHRDVHGVHMVLSVDDDPVNQMVVANLLQPLGYEVQQAMSGAEAIDALSAGNVLPDVMLLDCMMPGMSGYEVCRLVRARYGFHVPIIMVSANSSAKQVMLGLEEGANDYIKKPFHRDELNLRICAQVRTTELYKRELEHRAPAVARADAPFQALLEAAQLGAREGVTALNDTAVLHCELRTLWTTDSDSARACRELAPLLQGSAPALRSECAAFGVLLWDVSGASVDCVADADSIPGALRALHLVLFAEHLSRVLCGMARERGVAVETGCAVTTGDVRAVLMNQPDSVLRTVVVGEAVHAAYALCAQAPPGSVYVRGDCQAEALTVRGYRVAVETAVLRGRGVEVYRVTGGIRGRIAGQAAAAEASGNWDSGDAVLLALKTDLDTLDRLWQRCKSDSPVSDISTVNDLQHKALVQLRTLSDGTENCVDGGNSTPSLGSRELTEKSSTVHALAARSDTSQGIDTRASNHVPMPLESVGTPPNSGCRSKIASRASNGGARCASVVGPGFQELDSRPHEHPIGQERNKALTTSRLASVPLRGAVSQDDLQPGGFISHSFLAQDDSRAEALLQTICERVGAAEYLPLLQAHGITVPQLAKLTDGELQSIGLETMGLRMRLSITAREAIAAQQVQS